MNDSIMFAIIGGAFIGMSAVIMLAALGRITGISGLFAQVIYQPLQFAEQQWRMLFLLGLILGPVFVHQLVGVTPPPMPTNSPMLAIIGGLLVGFGTQVGSGCTSGHGICGISRLSVRSLIATLTFMAAGVVTVFTISLIGIRG